MLTAVAVLLAVLNLGSFALFGVDKGRARRGARRVPESTLLLSGLVSGTIGAWSGVYGFRHKTRTPWFLARLAAASFVDVITLVLLIATR